ncbi:MAG: hypothetical protein H7X77_04250 [Anaerolineae bacterium]|nr:hypothetical protein [Anaerolineae bacterium]
MYDQPADDFTFAEIRAILERRYARRMRVVKTFLSGAVAIGVITFLTDRAYSYVYNLRISNATSTNEYIYYYNNHTLITGIAAGLILLAVIRFALTLFDMFVGGAKDRALRHEIEQERTWRLRQWQARGYMESDSDVYQMTDDGEVEAYTSQTKRKRLTEHDF